MHVHNPDAGFRNLVKAIYEEQRSYWASEHKDWEPTPKALNIKQTIFGWVWKGIDEKTLEDLLSPDRIDFAEKFVLFMPPFAGHEEANFVPAISISYENGSKCFSIRSIMVTTTGRKAILSRAICFRIESPTGDCQPSKKKTHDFYHVQLIREFGYGPHMDQIIDWLPETQPSFPIYAHEPIDALLCLILTLYGSAYYREFLSRHGNKFMSHASKAFLKFNDTFLQVSP